jgi:hypothetical protein
MGLDLRREFDADYHGQGVAIAAINLQPHSRRATVIGSSQVSDSRVRGIPGSDKGGWATRTRSILQG